MCVHEQHASRAPAGHPREPTGRIMWVTESFPRQAARTKNFTLGAPRSFHITSDGQTVLFLRSQGGTDPVTCLWALDVATGRERLVADPKHLDGAAQQARRERVREQASGIVSFAADRDCTIATFTLSGSVYAADLRREDGAAQARALATATPAADPRPDPTGRLIAYVSAGALRVYDLRSGEDRALADPRGADGISFGLAEFIAAEEMERTRGYWWAPDGSAILTQRTDESPVHVWYIADPMSPASPPRAVRYPAAGTDNAVVTLYVAALDATLTEVIWDRRAFPYLVTASWERAGSGRPFVVVLSRDQKDMRVLRVDAASGATSLIRADTDPHWVDIVPGVPRCTTTGRLVWTADAGGAKRLVIGSAAEHAAGVADLVTPTSLNLSEVLTVDGDTVLFTATEGDPASESVWAAGSGGLQRVSPAEGMHGGTLAGGTLVLTSRTLASTDLTVTVQREGAEVARIGSLAQAPDLPAPRPRLIWSGGPSRVRTAILLPSWHEPGAGPLPVLCDPYGGPHGNRVTAAAASYLTPQWLADQGFAVVIADGRGMAGRGPASDRAIAGDLAGPALADQIEALHAAARQCADLDLTRVAIRGWSFGG